MSDIIFAKYNRNRKPEYQIGTYIGQENGEKYVIKAALTEEAKKHIASLEEYGKAISKAYRNLKIEMPIFDHETRTARFPYLNGITKSEQIKLSLNSRDQFVATVNQFLDTVFSLNESCITAFAQTEEFIAVFGNHACLEGIDATTVANIDLIPDNLIETESGLYCLDYEWVFLFPVPIAFIRFRALANIYEKHPFEITKLMDEETYWKTFAVSKEAREVFSEMEKSFQEFVHGKNNENRYVDRYQKDVIDLNEIHKRVDERNAHIQKQDYTIKQDSKLIFDKDVHIRNLESMMAEMRTPAGRWNKLMRFLPIRALRWLYRKCRSLIHKIKNNPNKKIYQKLTVPFFESPKVSIVIPVYNQFGYTYACIKSIIETVTEVSYEIIIGDDLSTDKTKKIQSIIKGVMVNKNETDHGFLMNCNRAAQKARGEYIIFLNNDTQVKTEWLSSLVELMESDDTIGMTGSKLVYPDGTLQEAGGIIWSDASGWNYGRNQNPDMPEYNYVRECDYISGASIMIRTNLWKQLGGFDERFKPAYCEDSDLAFQVRQAGYRVVYQPKSVVVHFEGVSNGTDTAGTGLKRYQVENGVKFREKWAEELAKQYTSGQHAFLARERNRGKKVILVIDHYVPTFDKDAGSKTTMQYLKMFVKKGYIVKFIGDNYAQMEPYCSILQQLGIEVLYGEWYRDHIFEWIDANKEYIDIAYLNRPHIAEKYIDFIKEKTDIKCIFYGHDLHFLRTRREADIEDNPDKLMESEMWLDKELSIMRKSAISYYPSYIEEEAIHEMDPRIAVKAITAYVFEEFIKDFEYDYASREGILFVGGFSHPPNADAVKWFVKEIWPSVYKNLGTSFFIVGSNAPDEIKALNGENGVVVKGFVSEEELHSLYHNCRIVVVPLRYGAGVKGKVVEAIYNGLPIVTTDVGAEGLPDVENVVSIKNISDEFANEIISLYKNEQKLVEMAMESQKYIREHFSLDAVWDIIKEDFE